MVQQHTFCNELHPCFHSICAVFCLIPFLVHTNYLLRMSVCGIILLCQTQTHKLTAPLQFVVTFVKDCNSLHGHDCIFIITWSLLLTLAHFTWNNLRFYKRMTGRIKSTFQTTCLFLILITESIMIWQPWQQWICGR